jgi:hypothetical protein
MSLATVLVIPLLGMFVVGAVISLFRSGDTLVRFVEVACLITIAVAALSALIGVGGSFLANTTTFEVPLSVHVPGVRIPGLSVDKPAAVITSGGADRATITFTGLRWLSRILLASESLVQVTVTIVVALVVLRLARNVRAGKPFEGLARSLIQCAIVLFVGALLWSLVGGIGSFVAGREALEIHSWGAVDRTLGAQLYPQSPEDLSYLGWPEPTMSISLPFWPLGIASVLALLGAAFRTGERLQADTEGLI